LLSNVLKVCFALPVYQAINLTAYAMTQRGWTARVGTILAFLPIFVITTGCWLMAWYMTLSINFFDDPIKHRIPLIDPGQQDHCGHLAVRTRQGARRPAQTIGRGVARGPRAAVVCICLLDFDQFRS
jgi:hypothetical protein